jgi:hypothetical protein
VNAFPQNTTGGYAQYRYDKQHKWCATLGDTHAEFLQETHNHKPYSSSNTAVMMDQKT